MIQMIGNRATAAPESGGEASGARLPVDIQIGVETLADLLSQHRAGVYSNSSPVCTIPPKSDLRDARLAHADLSSFCLEGVKLAQADLSNANLQKARLRRADMRGACLAGADLRGADLSEVDLREASLAGADLRDNETPLRCAGLLLGGADLADARVPASLRVEADLKSTQDAAGMVNNIFLLLAAAIGYCALTMFTTTDDKLVPNASAALIPFIQSSVPIRNFFEFAPVALILVSLYFQLNLLLFFRTAGRVPRRFPDGSGLSERLSHWALSALLTRWHGPRNAAAREDPADHLAAGAAVFLFWWAVPLEILLLWVRYLACHDAGGSRALIALALGAVLMAAAAYRLSRLVTRGKNWSTEASPSAVLTLALILAVSGILMLRVSQSSAEGTDWGTFTSANFENREVSSRPEKWDEKNPVEVRGAKLAGINLAHVRAHLAFLAHADLHGAHLTYGNFSESDLRGADLRGADLTGTQFLGANLEGARLDNAVFLDQSLERSVCSASGRSAVHFQTFPEADLSGARFSEKADLCQVSFHGAHLAGTYLVSAELPQADLGEAILDKTHLSGAILEYADFKNSQLSGTDLSGSDLRNADFSGAEVDCPKADGANLDGATITDAQLRRIHMNDKTSLGQRPRVKSDCP
jgi:uncharacterized protein YjbI with pentapeptide repeats